MRTALIDVLRHQSGPGANSFGGGSSQKPPLSFDAEHNILGAMMRWVEDGVAPSKIVAVKYKDDVPANGVAFTRPICKVRRTRLLLPGTEDVWLTRGCAASTRRRCASGEGIPIARVASSVRDTVSRVEYIQCANSLRPWIDYKMS